MNRRMFLSLLKTGAMGVTLHPLFPLFSKAESIPAPSPASPQNSSPIQTVPSGETQTHYSGDQPHTAHSILWNLKALAEKNAWPQPTETKNLVIIGGGVSGLLSGYFLKKHQPVILEQAHQFGGNSQAEKLDDSLYSIGAAYIAPPEEGDEIDTFLKEIGIHSSFRETKEGDFDFLIIDSIPDTETKNAFKTLKARVIEVLENGYPELPKNLTLTPSDRKSAFAKLDGISFEDWLKSKKIALHLPMIRTYVNHYCASTFGGLPQNLSAAQVLNFMASDFTAMFVPPGGNAFIANAIYEDLQKTLPKGNLRSGSIVVNVDLRTSKIDGNKKVWITYLNEKHELKTIEAKRAIVTTPKFIAKKFIACMPEKQKKAIDQYEYHPYLVANVILKTKIPSINYDIFSYSEKVSFTDIIFASWVKKDEDKHSILTLYRPYTDSNDRKQILPDESYGQQKKQFETEIRKVLTDIYPKKNWDKEILDIRITRWGHPIPLAKPGMVIKGINTTASSPIQNKIFFVNQDNMLNPAFESCFFSALECSKKIT